MPHKSRIFKRQVVTRRTFAAHVLGTAPCRSVSALKAYLHAAGKTPTRDDRLDLVILEDVEHLEDLLAQHGVPLAREDELPPDRPLRATITLPVYAWVALAMLVVGTTLDDVISFATRFDIVPWF